MMVRAFFRAAKVANATAPYDTITLKVYYPAVFGDTPNERNTGVIPADTNRAPYPVVIFLPGVNVGMESYAWLAVELARRGVVTMLMSWIAEDLPGSVALTPGMDLAALKADAYGSGPSASALPAMLEELSRLNESSVLAGLLDVNKVILGGHSAGGTIALLNANREWFPQVVGSFAYGAHSGASTMLGYAAGTVLSLPENPLLIIGGAQDGVVEASSHRYALDGQGTPTLLLERTFAEAAKNPAALAILEGANHFLACHPHDDTTGRGFLEQPASGDQAALRQVFVELVDAFIRAAVGRQSFESLAQIARENPFITRFETR